MPKQVNVHQAKTHLSQLLVEVQQGEEIIIAKSGKPVARLCQAMERMPTRVPGSAKGQLTLSEDFDAPLPEVIVKPFDSCESS